MTTIINRNASIPVKQSDVFSTGSDSQETVEIHVLQGERTFAKDNKSLGVFRLKGIPAAPRGVPKINVTFQLDVNGILSVSAREEKSGKEQSITIEGASVLGREEVSKMIKEAEENSLQDKAKRSLVNISYELDTLFVKADRLNLKLSEQFGSTDILSYFNELVIETRQFYIENKLTDLLSNSLMNLKYSYNLLVLEYIKNQLKSGKSNMTSVESDNIIDVDVAEDI